MQFLLLIHSHRFCISIKSADKTLAVAVQEDVSHTKIVQHPWCRIGFRCFLLNVRRAPYCKMFWYWLFVNRLSYIKTVYRREPSEELWKMWLRLKSPEELILGHSTNDVKCNDCIGTGGAKCLRHPCCSPKRNVPDWTGKTEEAEEFAYGCERLESPVLMKNYPKSEGSAKRRVGAARSLLV